MVALNIMQMMPLGKHNIPIMIKLLHTCFVLAETVQDETLLLVTS